MQDWYWTVSTKYLDGTAGSSVEALHDPTHLRLWLGNASGPYRVEEPATHGFAVPENMIMRLFFERRESPRVGRYGFR